MKRKISIVLSLLFIVALVFALASCGHEHTYGETWSSDENNHWHAPTCDDTTDPIDLAAHTWNEGVITTPATKSTQGVKTFTCTVCSATRTENVKYVYSAQDIYDVMTSYYEETGDIAEAAKLAKVTSEALKAYLDETKYSIDFQTTYQGIYVVLEAVDEPYYSTVYSVLADKIIYTDNENSTLNGYYTIGGLFLMVVDETANETTTSFGYIYDDFGNLVVKEDMSKISDPNNDIYFDTSFYDENDIYYQMLNVRTVDADGNESTLVFGFVIDDNGHYTYAPDVKEPEEADPSKEIGSFLPSINAGEILGPKYDGYTLNVTPFGPSMMATLFDKEGNKVGSIKLSGDANHIGLIGNIYFVEEYVEVPVTASYDFYDEYEGKAYNVSLCAYDITTGEKTVLDFDYRIVNICEIYDEDENISAFVLYAYSFENGVLSKDIDILILDGDCTVTDVTNDIDVFPDDMCVQLEEGLYLTYNSYTAMIFGDKLETPIYLYGVEIYAVDHTNKLLFGSYDGYSGALGFDGKVAIPFIYEDIYIDDSYEGECVINDIILVERYVEEEDKYVDFAYNIKTHEETRLGEIVNEEGVVIGYRNCYYGLIDYREIRFFVEGNDDSRYVKATVTDGAGNVIYEAYDSYDCLSDNTMYNENTFVGKDGSFNVVLMGYNYSTIHWEEGEPGSISTGDYDCPYDIYSFTPPTMTHLYY